MTPEKEKIWEEATKKAFAKNSMGDNWERISIAMDLYAESQLLSPKIVIGYSKEQIAGYMKSVNDLVFMAETSGGTAGKDERLINAMDLVIETGKIFLSDYKVLDLDEIYREWYATKSNVYVDQEPIKEFVNHLKEKIKQ